MDIIVPRFTFAANVAQITDFVTMAYHKLAVSALLAATISTSKAFAPSSSRHLTSRARADASSLRMVATTPADLGIGQGSTLGNEGNDGNDGDKKSGSMMDLTGIAFSVGSIMDDNQYLITSASWCTIT